MNDQSLKDFIVKMYRMQYIFFFLGSVLPAAKQ